MRTIKIAIIENEADISRELSTAVASDSRFEILYISDSVKEILSKIITKSEPPEADIVILSYELQDNGAVRLLDALSDIPYSERPYMIVTSRIWNNVIIGYLSSIGACDFVHKPYNVDVMIDRLSYLYSYLNNIRPSGRTEKYPETYSAVLREPDRLTLGREEQRVITGVTFDLLLNSQIPITSTGFKYIVQAVSILYYMNKEDYQITKDIYPKIAAINMVSPETVERCIRSSVGKGWARSNDMGCGRDHFNLFTKYTRRPTNSELIKYASYCVKKIIENQLNIS